MLPRFLFFSLALAGCGGTSPPPPPPPPMPLVEALTLGSVDDAGVLVPYTDGQDVTLVEGAQGGFHVWMSYGYGGTVGGTAKLSRGAHRLSDGAIVLRTSTEATVVPQSMPLPMFMCPSPIGLSVIDQPIVFSIDLSDESGAIADGSVTLVPRCPDDNRDFCLRICTG